MLKKRNYFVFSIYQVNKYGVSRRCFTETNFKDFMSGTLRTITQI